MMDCTLCSMYVFMHKFIYLHIVVVVPFPFHSLHCHRSAVYLSLWTGTVIRNNNFIFGEFQFSCDFLERFAIWHCWVLVCVVFCLPHSTIVFRLIQTDIYQFYYAIVDNSYISCMKFLSSYFLSSSSSYFQFDHISELGL